MAIKATSKKPLFGNRRSHALNATKHAQKPNLQTYTLDGEKIVTTAREARTFRKEERNQGNSQDNGPLSIFCQSGNQEESQ